MKLSACRRLALRPIRATWYRAIAAQHWKTALKTDHTSKVTTRFNPGKVAANPFEILYLAENQVTALYEVGAIFGPPNQAVSNPHQSKILTIDVNVCLNGVADLTDPVQRALIEFSIQELTGNWDTYDPGEAPTQQLGAALYATKGLEGFLTISAKMPRSKTLIVFPEKLLKRSELVFEDLIQGETHRIAGS